MSPSPYQETLLRSGLPRVMFVPDVAVALQCSEGAARRAILRGWCGPYLRLGRRLAVLRDSFLEALAARARAREEGQDVG